MKRRSLRLEVEGQLVHGALEGNLDPRLPVVVYLHGFGSSGFGDKGEFFSTRVVEFGLPFCRFDLRGHGESGGELARITVARNLLDLEAVTTELRRRGFSSFILTGSSYGALSGLVYAARFPQEIVAGAFIAPAVGIAASIRRREGAHRLAAWRSEGAVPLEDGERRLAWSFFEDAERWSGAEITVGLKTPCLLFHGLQDAEVDWSGVHAFAMDAHCVQLHGFVDGDHRLIEYLPRIWEETERFLRKLVATTTTAPRYRRRSRPRCGR